MREITKSELQQGRIREHEVVGYFRSYCDLHSCCEECNGKVKFLCKLKRKLENIQTKIILKEVNKNGIK